MEIIKDLTYRFKKLTFRIKKLIAFIKLGWNDNDWDHGYLIDILEYKFKAMENYFDSSDIALDNKKSAQICRVLRKSLDKYNNIDYYHKYMEKHQPFEKHWRFEPSETQGFSRMIWVRSDTGVDCTPEELEVYGMYVRRASNYEQRMKKKYKKVFFKTLYKHIEKLWD